MVGTSLTRLCPPDETERITASASSPANSSSPASRLDLNTRRHSAPSLMSNRLICQARCTAKAASPIQAGQSAPPSRRNDEGSGCRYTHPGYAYVRFTAKATELLRRREMTQCAHERK
jgi:hypothetical protein